MKHLKCVCEFFLLFTVFSVVSGETMYIKVNDRTELRKAVKNVVKGDTIVLKDGKWSDVNIQIYKIGEKENPITIRAETPGGVDITGNSQLSLSGKYIIVGGFRFVDGAAQSGTVIQFRSRGRVCHYCKLEDVLVKQFEDGNKKNHWVRVFGTNNQVVNCQFSDKGIGHKYPGKMVWVHAKVGEVNNHIIANNNFVNYEYIAGSKNGREALQIGSSHTWKTKTGTIIRNNYFKSCNGDTEIVTVKATHANFIGNIFQNCHGNFSLRHTGNTIIQNNKFLGDFTERCGGLQLRGVGNTIKGNWFQNIKDAAIVIQGNLEGRWLKWYPAEDGIIEDNTFVNNLVGIALGTWPYKKMHYIAPKRIQIKNNKIVSSRAKSSMFQVRNKYDDFSFSGNEVGSGNVGMESNTGIIIRKDMSITPLVLDIHVLGERGPSYMRNTS